MVALGGGSGSGQDTLDALGNISGAVTIPFGSGPVFSATLTGNVTFTFTGSVAGVACTMTLYLTQDATGGRTVTWPGSVTWIGGTQPTAVTTPGALNIYTFQTLNNGTTWYGSLATELPALPLVVANGGTGDASLTAFSVLAGGTSSTGPVQSVAALGSTGAPLTSNGAGALPDFTTALAAVVNALTDAATIAVNANLGNFCTVTLGGNRTMGAPSNPLDGQVLMFALKQDGTGSRTVTWTSGAGGFSFGTSGAPTLTTTAGATDLVGFRYSAIVGKWLYQGSQLGFS